MGLTNPYMVKQAIGKTAGQTLELEADTGESFLVKGIYVGKNDADFLDMTIDKTMVGRWRAGKTLGGHVKFGIGSAKHSHNISHSGGDVTTVVGEFAQDAFGNASTQHAIGVELAAGAETFKRALDYETSMRPDKNLMTLLGDMGIFKGYPIAEGQKMILKPATATQYLGNVVIMYERYEGGDIKKEMENGSESLEYMFINYGDVGSAITTADDWLINTLNSPSEFPDFPIGKDVPAKTEIDLLGILGTESYDWDDATHISYTKYLKLVRERTTLFDDDRNGLLFLGYDRGEALVGTYYGEGYSMIGNYSHLDMRAPFMFPEPLTFMAGEELNAYITSGIVTNAASIAQAGSEIGFIEKVRRVA